MAAIRAALESGDGDLARELLRQVVEALPEPEPGGEELHIGLLLELDRLAWELGSLEQSLRLAEDVLEARTRFLPSDHPDLLVAKENLAGTKHALGDLLGAHELAEQVLEARTRLFPGDHPDLLAAKQNLAGTKYALGDLLGAHELAEQVLEARTRLLPSDHPDLLAAKQGLALTKKRLGDLLGARELEEQVLEARTRLLPADHPDLLVAKLNLAGTRHELGDLLGARELYEQVLEARKRLLPSDHPDLLAAKQGLALTKRELGDLLGARELEEQVVEARTRLLPSDHPDLLAAKLNLAGTKYQLGDLLGAHELAEQVLAAQTRLLPSDHPDLLAAKRNLALTKRELGDLLGARELEEQVLEARTRLLPSDHPDLLAAKGNLALTKKALGDLLGARELEEQVLEAWSRLLPSEHPDLLMAKRNLATSKIGLGELPSAREIVASLLEGERQRARSLHAESARAAREGARVELERLFAALCLGAATGGTGLAAELFATLEELRAASVASPEFALALAERPELDSQRRALAELRAKLNDLAALGPEEGADVEAWRKELRDLAFARDELERELRVALEAQGVFAGEIDAASVAGALGDGALAISYLRYPRQLPSDPATAPRVDSLLAFAVRPGGEVVRVELGPAGAIEELASAWRASIGKPVLARGVGAVLPAGDVGETEALGLRLRAAILDPILAAAGTPIAGIEVLHVLADDFLHLVPLEALPVEGGLLGERIAIRNEVTFARLLRPPAASRASPRLVLAGAIDYDAELEPEDDPRIDAATPPTAAGAPLLGFAPLPETAVEAAAIAGLFQQVFEEEAVVLMRGEAVKSALAEHAPSARFLHLATHGWFALDASRAGPGDLARADERGRAALTRAEETVRGFAPETLCGLALAGANKGRDAVGRAPGILTAEELSTLDLRNCELAVLSACETNVGIRRAGQGIQSLQAALHGAGARTAITSLWRVDDAATRRLFELFYAKLWQEQLGKAEALWQAKTALRAEGHPLRDWAAWVLTGAPD